MAQGSLKFVRVRPQAVHQVLLLSPPPECEHKHSRRGVWPQKMCNDALRWSFFPFLFRLSVHNQRCASCYSPPPPPPVSCLLHCWSCCSALKRGRGKHTLQFRPSAEKKQRPSLAFIFTVMERADSLTPSNNPFSPLLSVSAWTSGDLERDFLRCSDSSRLGVRHFAFLSLCHRV